MSNHNVAFIFVRRELEKVTKLIQERDFTTAEGILLKLVEKIDAYGKSSGSKELHSIAKIYYLLGRCMSSSSRIEEACVYFEKSYEIIISIDKKNHRSSQTLFLELATAYAKALSRMQQYEKALKQLEPAVKYSKELPENEYLDLILPMYKEYAMLLNALGHKRSALKAVNFLLKRLKRLYSSHRQYLIELAHARCIKSEIIIQHSPVRVFSLIQITLAVLESWFFLPNDIPESDRLFLKTMKKIGDIIFEFMVSGKKAKVYTEAIEYAHDDSVNGNLISLIPTSAQEEFFLAWEAAEYEEKKPDPLFVLYFYYLKMFKYLSYILREENLSKSKLTHFKRLTKTVLGSLSKSFSPLIIDSEIMCARYYILLAEFYIKLKKYKKALKNLDSAFNIYSSLVSGDNGLNKENVMYAFCYIQEKRACVCELLNKKREIASLFSYTADLFNDIKADFPILTLTKLIIMMHTRAALAYDDVRDFEKSEQSFSSSIDVFNAYRESVYYNENNKSENELYDEIADCVALNYFRRGTAKTRLSTRNYSSSLRDYQKCVELLTEISDSPQTAEKLSIVYKAISEIYEVFGELEAAEKYYLLSMRSIEKQA